MPKKTLRENIDAMIDYRKRFRPHDTSPIEVIADPADMHRALHILNTTGTWPYTCLYRGYKIHAKKRVRAGHLKDVFKPPPKREYKDWAND